MINEYHRKVQEAIMLFGKELVKKKKNIIVVSTNLFSMKDMLKCCCKYHR